MGSAVAPQFERDDCTHPAGFVRSAAEKETIMFASYLVGPLADVGFGDFRVSTITLVVLIILLIIPEIVAWLTIRYIPNDYVGIVEKLWSASGSVPEGRIIALN